jgi:hypothetical protein
MYTQVTMFQKTQLYDSFVNNRWQENNTMTVSVTYAPDLIDWMKLFQTPKADI